MTMCFWCAWNFIIIQSENNRSAFDSSTLKWDWVAFFAISMWFVEQLMQRGRQESVDLCHAPDSSVIDRHRLTRLWTSRPGACGLCLHRSQNLKAQRRIGSESFLIRRAEKVRNKINLKHLLTTASQHHYWFEENLLHMLVKGCIMGNPFESPSNSHLGKQGSKNRNLFYYRTIYVMRLTFKHCCIFITCLCNCIYT